LAPQQEINLSYYFQKHNENMHKLDVYLQGSSFYQISKLVRNHGFTEVLSWKHINFWQIKPLVVVLQSGPDC